MSRTFRKKYPNQDEWADREENQRHADKLRKGADGMLASGIAASATEGVYEKWDEVPRSYGNRMAHKDIRRHNKAMVKAGLKENEDD